MTAKDTHTATPELDAPGFDLDGIEDVGSADYEVLHPVTREATGAFITLAGPEHPDRKKMTMSLIRRQRADALRTKPKATDIEDEIDESRDMLAKVTLGWRGMRKAGAPLPFSQAAAKELYADPKSQWLVKQLMQAMNNAELFIKA